jgi:SAM-dependent methyltransferase
VGPEGLVVGIDRAPEAVSTAMRRATDAGWQNVHCQVADVEAFESSEPFNGIIGRFVLLYLADPAATLRSLWQLLTPGGVMAFLEYDLTATHSLPPVPLFDTALTWMHETLRRGRVPLDLGPQLWRLFRAAGIGEPSVFIRQKLELPPASYAMEVFVSTLRSLLPMAEHFGVVTAAEVEIDTLADRLRAAALAHESTIFSPAVVGTWCRKPK